MTLAKDNVDLHKPKAQGISGWRELYLRFLHRLTPTSVLELGSGDSRFLAAIPSTIRRLAIDGGDRFRADFVSAGCEFYRMDLDHDPIPTDIGTVQTVVCSDVLEHLLYPERAIQITMELLDSDGILFAHVPNEFHWLRTTQIMLGKKNAVYFHDHCNEWENPHLRRFTDIGFRKLLEDYFVYNLKLTDLRYGPIARLLNNLGVKPPYCLELGPTYASTNDVETHRELILIKDYLKRRHKKI